MYVRDVIMETTKKISLSNLCVKNLITKQIFSTSPNAINPTIAEKTAQHTTAPAEMSLIILITGLYS